MNVIKAERDEKTKDKSQYIKFHVGADYHAGLLPKIRD